jgi:hypothetical protein
MSSVVLKNKSEYEKKLFIAARDYWKKYGNYYKMIECLEKKGFKDAKFILTNLSLEECGFILGVTRERIRQIFDQALKKLRKYFYMNKELRELLADYQ